MISTQFFLYVDYMCVRPILLGSYMELHECHFQHRTPLLQRFIHYDHVIWLMFSVPYSRGHHFLFFLFTQPLFFNPMCQWRIGDLPLFSTKVSFRSLQSRFPVICHNGNNVKLFVNPWGVPWYEMGPRGLLQRYWIIYPHQKEWSCSSWVDRMVLGFKTMNFGRPACNSFYRAPRHGDFFPNLMSSGRNQEESLLYWATSSWQDH